MKSNKSDNLPKYQSPKKESINTIFYKMTHVSEEWTNQQLLKKLEETVDLVSALMQIVKEQGQMISELQNQLASEEGYRLMSSEESLDNSWCDDVCGDVCGDDLCGDMYKTSEEDLLIQEETDDVVYLSQKVGKIHL